MAVVPAHFTQDLGLCIRKLREPANASLRFQMPGQDWNMTGAELAELLVKMRRILPQMLIVSPERYIPMGKDGICVQAGLIPAYVAALRKPLDLAGSRFVCIQPEDAPPWTVWLMNWKVWITTQFARLWERKELPPVQEMSQEAFLAHVGEMRKGKRGRVIEDPYFQDWMASDFLKGGVWSLAKLRGQIEKDLLRTDVRLNNRRVLAFCELCVGMGLSPALFEQERRGSAELSEKENRALRFMAMLHQGTLAAPLMDASRYFDGNPAGLIPTQPTDTPLRDLSGGGIEYPTRICAYYDNEVQEIIAEQELALRHPDPTVESYPIRGRVRAALDKPAIVSWRFVS